MKKFLNYFSRGEIILWLCEIILIITFFCIFDRTDFLNLIASLVGVTALIFCAKGNPIGQALVILFSILYGIISYGFAYYGEMMTYVGMTLPMAVISLVSWVKNPNGENRSEVKIRSLKRIDMIILIPTTILVTVTFYFILKALGTASLLTSTISVATSFAAAFLAFKRSPYYALGYVFNDIVLIVLWSFAAFESMSYLSVIACFVAFLINDVYTFVNWKKIQKRQKA